MSTVHAKLSPSSAERWFNCAGSINFINYLAAQMKVVYQTNKYAAEGTVAHQLAEDFVTNKVDLLTLTSRVGETVMQDNFEIEITDAMIEGVIEYVDHIAAVKKTLHKPAPIVGEAEVRVIASSVSDEVFGTADYLLYQKGNELHVFDFKFGKGVVEAEDNKQGLIYLVGAADTIGTDVFSKVFFHIIQPRARHNEGSARPWELPAGRLPEFRRELAAAVKRTQDQKAPRVAGTWCKYCPAIAYCPEAKGAVESAVQTVFTKLPMPPSKEVGQMSLPPVAALTAAQVASALDWEDTIDSWFEAVRERALTELVKDAHSVPGYKLVEGKTNRSWGIESEVETAFSMLGEELYAPRKIKSPAQLEKIAGEEEVAKFTVKLPGKLTVAKMSDKRQAAGPVAPGDAAGVFGVIDTVAVKVDEENIFGDLGGPVVEKKREPFWPS